MESIPFGDNFDRCQGNFSEAFLAAESIQVHGGHRGDCCLLLVGWKIERRAKSLGHTNFVAGCFTGAAVAVRPITAFIVPDEFVTSPPALPILTRVAPNEYTLLYTGECSRSCRREGLSSGFSSTRERSPYSDSGSSTEVVFSLTTMSQLRREWIPATTLTLTRIDPNPGNWPFSVAAQGWLGVEDDGRRSPPYSSSGRCSE